MAHFLFAKMYLFGVPVGSLSPTSTINVCVCEYISRTFALQFVNRVSWFCCCVWSENVIKKWHVSCVCWCGWRLSRTRGIALVGFAVVFGPKMC